MDNKLISNKELIEMGYRPHTANDISHQARESLEPGRPAGEMTLLGRMTSMASVGPPVAPPPL